MEFIIISYGTANFITHEKWYVAWDEIQANILGWYKTYEEAKQAIIDYAKTLDPKGGDN